MALGEKNLKNSLADGKRKMQQSLANMLEIPEDMMLNLPKVTIMGNTHVFIENHMGVIEYSPQKLRIGVAFGEIVITGSNFFLKSILSEELSLEGKIDSVVFNT